MLDFLHDLDLGVISQIALIEYTTVGNIAAFSQLALIECTTDGDLEYFLGYGIEIFFFNQGHHPAWIEKKKKLNFFFFFFL